MIADEDNFLLSFSRDAVVFRNCLYMGTYIPLAGVTAPYPIFLLDADSSVQLFPNEGTLFGSTTGTGGHDGGVMHSATHGALLQYNGAFLTETGFAPNAAKSGTAYDRQDILIGKATAGGTLGQIDPDFIRAVHATIAHGTTLDAGANIVLGGTTSTLAKQRFSWDGATTIGTGTAREGVDS